MSEPSDIVEALAALCRQQPLTIKWLLVPSLRVGRQWMDAACQSAAVINVRPVTQQRLTFELARPELRKRRLRLVDSARAELLLRRVLVGSSGGYLRWTTPNAAVIRSVLRTVTDLRLAGVSLDGVSHGAFEVATKGAELKKIVADYGAALRAERLADQADVLKLAVNRLTTSPRELGRDALLLWPEQPQSGTGLRLWRAVPERNRRLLTEQPTSTSDIERDVELLRHVDNPTAAPAARGDGTLKVRTAIGEISEVWQVLRWCLQQRLPVDQVEVLYCDGATYPSLLFSVMQEVFGADPPVTFAEGLPVRLFRPGRALAAWVRWQREGFVASTLAAMLQDRLIVAGEDDPPAEVLGATLRSLPIGMGRDRYLSQIDEALGKVDKAVMARQLNALRSLVADLLSDVSETSTEPLQIVDAASRFVADRVVGRARNDAYARRSLLRALESQRNALAKEVGSQQLQVADIWDRLVALPERLRIGGMGPRPGRLHVASIWSGGYARRDNVFVVGMDDQHFPGSERQDPLLLDRERQRLSDRLSTAKGRRGQRQRQAHELLARIGARSAQVVLSSSCLDLADGRELHDSSELVAARRLLSGVDVGDGSPATFTPDSEPCCCTPAQWWVWRLCRTSSRGSPAEGDSERLVGAYPHLDRGLIARRARCSDRFTEYDGHVPQAGKDLDPWTPGAAALSATALEMLGRCPMDYFCRHVLRIEVPAAYQSYRDDPGQWPGPGRRGAMLHEVFYRYMTLMQQRRLQPRWARDARVLSRLVDEQIARLCAVDPAPDSLARQRLSAELHRTADIFLREEQRQCGSSVPFCFEASIGMPSNVSTPLDTVSPVSVQLGGRGSVRFAGKIDRVDLLLGRGTGMRFAVWDYKTGSSYQYEEGDAFRSGRSVQPFVYHALVEQQLRRSVSPQARVAQFGFFFPGVREHGRRISWPPDSLARGAGIVADLCAMIAAGCFPSSDDVADMNHSVYSKVYGPAETAARAARRKLDGSDSLLDHYRRLRGDNG